MYKFDEQALRKGINMGLGSQGIWTPELEDVMFNEITNKALRIHDVVGQKDELDEIIRAVRQMDAPEGWIPVSKQLPEHENNVLAVLDGQVHIMCYLKIRFSLGYLKVWAMVYDALGGDAHFDDEYHPTHWMEIPKPPKNILHN